MSEFKVEIDGVEGLLDKLDNIGPRHSRNLMRSTVHGIAGEISKSAKKLAPKDKGDLIKAIKTKRRRSPPTRATSDVVVEHGNNAKHDGFHWRFHEYGTKIGVRAKHFFRKSAEKVRSNFTNIMTEQFGKKLEAALKREAKRNAKK